MEPIKQNKYFWPVERLFEESVRYSVRFVHGLIIFAGISTQAKKIDKNSVFLLNKTGVFIQAIVRIKTSF